jgi:phage terminase large subunit GpA-like protein
VTLTLSGAVSIVERQVQRRCRACGQQRMLDKDGYRFEGMQRLTTVTAKHTCFSELAAIRDLAEAAVNEVSLPCPRVIAMIYCLLPNRLV